MVRAYDTSRFTIVPSGQELVFLLEGAIELLVEANVAHPEAGHAFSFDSDLGHGYRNAGERTARIIWVKTPPTF